MSSYQYRKSHCGDKTVVRSSYLHNGISYTGKMSSLYWIGALVPTIACPLVDTKPLSQALLYYSGCDNWEHTSVNFKSKYYSFHSRRSICKIVSIMVALTSRLQRDNQQHQAFSLLLVNGLLARYVKLRVVHAPGMPGMFSSPPRVSDPDMYHGTCVTHVPWCMPHR